jgi:hypothetical protein
MIKSRVIDRFYCNSTKQNRNVGDLVVYSKERTKEILSKGRFLEVLEVAAEPKAESPVTVKKTRAPRKPKNA